jgi:hypothetical protein
MIEKKETQRWLLLRKAGLVMALLVAAIGSIAPAAAGAARPGERT